MERFAEKLLGELERNAILRTLRSRETRLDRAEVELERVGEDRVGRIVRAEEALLLRVRFARAAPATRRVP